MTSEKGKMLLVVEGAKFCKGRRLQSGETHWRCVNKFCRAKLYTACFISLNIQCKMAMFSSKMDKSIHLK
jgi:hypothetical protein